MPAANFARFRQNLIYVVRESQIKLGYIPGGFTVNYPLSSLNAFLDTDCDEAGMRRVLADFCAAVAAELGEIRVSRYEGQFSLALGAPAVRYIHERFRGSRFLPEFIALFAAPGQPPSIEDILAVCRRYSRQVTCRRVYGGEFDYAVSFADGEPDDFIYCIELSGGRAAYHRLTPRDYAEAGFEE